MAKSCRGCNEISFDGHFVLFLQFRADTFTVPLLYEPHCEKPDFCLCENKGADQFLSNCEADQRLCYTPGIYADGYIVFAFPFVRSSVRMFVSSFVR